MEDDKKERLPETDEVVENEEQERKKEEELMKNVHHNQYVGSIKSPIW